MTTRRLYTLLGVLLLFLGALLFIIIRQHSALNRMDAATAQERFLGEEVIYSNLLFAYDALTPDEPPIGTPRSVPINRDDLLFAAASLEKAAIGMDIYRPFLQEEQLQIDLFNPWVFPKYHYLLTSIAYDLESQTTMNPEQRQMVMAIQHDIMLIQKTFMVLAATKQPLHEVATQMQAITPLVQVNPVRQELGLFPTRFPQVESGYSANITLLLHASTTCVEVGQPITFTLAIDNRNQTQQPIPIDSLRIAITEGQEPLYWSPTDTPLSTQDRLLPYGESRVYTWPWIATSALSGTTVTVQAYNHVPPLSPNALPTSELDGATLKVGIGTLTQTHKDRMVAQFPHWSLPLPQTMTCRAMVGP